MKKLLLFSLVAIGMACSAPKQYYMFRHTPSATPDKESNSEQMITREGVAAESSPVILDDKVLETQVADLGTTPETVEAIEEPELKVLSVEDYKSMSRTEKREVRKEIRNYVKEARTSNVESVKATQEFQMTGYTRVGVILAAAGVVLMVLTSGTIAALGGLLVLAGVIFVLIDIL